MRWRRSRSCELRGHSETSLPSIIDPQFLQYILILFSTNLFLIYVNNGSVYLRKVRLNVVNILQCSWNRLRNKNPLSDVRQWHLSFLSTAPSNLRKKRRGKDGGREEGETRTGSRDTWDRRRTRYDRNRLFSGFVELVGAKCRLKGNISIIDRIHDIGRQALLSSKRSTNPSFLSFTSNSVLNIKSNTNKGDVYSHCNDFLSTKFLN